MATRRTRSNGFWIKAVAAVVCPLLVIAIAGSVAWAWSTSGRVTVCETLDKTMGTDIAEIKADVKKLLGLVKPPGHP